MFQEDSSRHVVIVDSKGDVIYFTENNLPVYDLSYEDIIGRNISGIYKNLNKSNSSLIRSVKTGITVSNLKQGLETRKHKKVHQIGNTYPLIEENKIIGAIEFSKIISQDILTKTYIKKKVKENRYLENGTRYQLEDIITKDPSMLRLKDKIKKVSRTSSNVMIYGKTGTGKELVAQSIHNESNRKYCKFVSQNCGAIPANLLESILFGTEKGSFTGAEDKPGLFELANGGTIFLDEINSMDLSSQVKLLKVLEEGRVRRLGGLESIPIDVRVITASNEKVQTLLDSNKMRPDLYYRLAVVQLDIPDLKDRLDDIELLSNYFIDRYNIKFNARVKYIDANLLEIFKNYNWPGNVRELKNVIESSFNMLEGKEILENHIPENIIKYECKRTKFNDLKTYLEEHEKDIILKAYKKHENKLTKTANQLNISKQLLRYKLDKYGVE